MADGQPQPQATNRRCRAGFRVWAVVLGMAIVAGCSSPRIAAPSAEPDPSAPEFVAVPDDPADDPQLAAVALPPDRPGTPVSTTIESKIPELQRLRTLTRAVEAKVGPDVKALLVEVGTSTSVYVPVTDGVDQWRIGSHGEIASRPLQGAETDRFTGSPFALAELPLDAPVRVAVGLARRVPGATATSIELSDVDRRGLAWRFGLTRGGQSLTVVAAAGGSVLGVER